MLDLVARAKPLEPIRFPNGRELAARPLDADGWELVRAAQRNQDAASMLAAVKYVVPDATDDDLNVLGIEDFGAILTYAARQIVEALDTVGNSAGTGTTSTSPPSSPPPTPSTS